MAYVRRYVGGFLDRPATTTPADAAFLNAVEAELIRLGGSIVNADISGAAAIARSKLDFGAGLVNADIAAAAAIAKSKLAALAIVNADVDPAAAIVYSKLALAGSIVNADIAAAAAVSRTKLARDATILFNSGVFSLPFNAFTIVTFDSENLDDGNLHTGSGSRITIATAGLYLIGAYANFGNNAGGDKYMEIRVNNAAVVGQIAQNTVGTGITPVTASIPWQLAAGDFVELVLYQNQTSGLAFNIAGGIGGVKLWAVRL